MADNTPGQVFGPQNISDEADAARPETQASAPQPAPVIEPTTAESTPNQTIGDSVTEQPTPVTSASPEANQSAVFTDTQVSTNSPEPTDTALGVESNQYHLPDETVGSPSSLDPITWTASEYIAHHKTPLWYVVLAVLGIMLMVGVYVMTGGDIFSTVAVVLVTTIFAMYAARKPQVQQYAVGPDGVTIGQRTYSFHEIKSFALIDEGPFRSISFMPLKRFMPIISIYFDPADEAAIVDFLSNYLPIEHRNKDLIDRLMRKLKF